VNWKSDHFNLQTSTRSYTSSTHESDTEKIIAPASTTTDTLSPFKDSLKGCVCVVTGASRGIGKGIALELGAAGATVYVTGTTSSTSNESSGSPSKYVTNKIVGGPGTIEQTAKEIDAMGGKGIAYYCDHSDDEQVKSFFDHIQQSDGRLDILINNVFRIPNGGTKALFGNFWENESSIESWDAVHTVGLRSHYVCSKYAIPIMIKNSPKSKGKMNQPFIGMISSFGGLCYTFNVAYGVGKAAVDRLTKDIAYELTNAKKDINVMSFYPGVVNTERTQKSVQDGTWGEEVGIPLENAETPRFTGRAIISVATDPSLAVTSTNGDGNAKKDGRMQSSSIKSGSFQVVAELAEKYDFTDENGNRPPSIRSLKFLIPAYGLNGIDEKLKENLKKFGLFQIIPDWKLPFWIMENGAPPPSD